MHPIGPIVGEVERGPSRRDFWYSAFLASLQRLSVDEAVTEADRALVACNARWKKAHVVETFVYRDDYPVGDRVALTSDESENGS